MLCLQYECLPLALVSNFVFVFDSGLCSPVGTVSVMSAFPSLWSSTVLAIEGKL